MPDKHKENGDGGNRTHATFPPNNVQTWRCPECGNDIRVSVLHVKPGDTVVYTYPELLTTEQAERIRKQHHAFFGPDIKALIVAGGIEVEEST